MCGRAWVRTDYQAVSTPCQGHTRQGGPLPPHPVSGAQPRASRGNPAGSADAACAQTQAELGPEALCREARAHPTRSLGSGWGPGSLVGEGPCLVSLHPQESSSVERRTNGQAAWLCQRSRVATSPSEPQYPGPQNGRGGEPPVKLQGSGGWTRLFLPPGLGPGEPGRMS